MKDKIKTPYERVMLARDKDRLKITDYIDALFDDFVELKGDGITGEDSAILGGIAFYHATLEWPLLKAIGRPPD